MRGPALQIPRTRFGGAFSPAGFDKAGSGVYDFLEVPALEGKAPDKIETRRRSDEKLKALAVRRGFIPSGRNGVR
jgi:hypothetical protein